MPCSKKALAWSRDQPACGQQVLSANREVRWGLVRGLCCLELAVAEFQLLLSPVPRVRWKHTSAAGMCVKLGGGGFWEAISKEFGEISHRAVGYRLEEYERYNAEPRVFTLVEVVL